MFATEKHELHRVRRNAMNKFFSRMQISKLESIVKDLADSLCDKILRLSKSYSGPCLLSPSTNERISKMWVCPSMPQKFTVASPRMLFLDIVLGSHLDLYNR